MNGDNMPPRLTVRAVLFDFDGTLADSYGAITESVNHVRRCHGLRPLAETDVRRHVGRGLVFLLEQTIGDVDVDRDTTLYREHHPSVLRSHTRLLPHAAEVIAQLKERRALVGVCSNKPRLFTAELLEYLGLAAMVDVVVGPEDVALPKPAPDMLRAAMTRLNVQPDEALYVGDMRIDIEAARAAGMAVWVVATGSEEAADLEGGEPDLLLEDLSGLPSLLSVR